jgi:tRNA dimethylallyltransferase
MDIGTAKATAEERAAVPHCMIDFLPPTEPYSAESYRKAAMSEAERIVGEGSLPMFVGGTGLYIDTVMRGCEVATPESDPEYREKILADISSEEDRQRLWERLREVDPESAEKTHYNNIKRVIRALEIYDATGIPKSVFDRESRGAASDVSVKMITLDFHYRELLYKRVDKRVDIMMREGLYDEVLSLYEAGLLRDDTTAAQAIGYKEIVSAIRGECSLDEAVEEIKLSSRRYAKRQLTWFRHEKDAYRLYIDREDGTMRQKKDIIAEAVEAASEFMKGFDNESKRT